MRKGREVFTTSGTYPWSFVTQLSWHVVWPSYKLTWHVVWTSYRLTWHVVWPSYRLTWHVVWTSYRLTWHVVWPSYRLTWHVVWPFYRLTWHVVWPSLLFNKNVILRRVNLVTHPVISHEWGKDGKCLRQMEHIRGHLWHNFLHRLQLLRIAI
jgi:hypothetical protein